MAARKPKTQTPTPIVEQTIKSPETALKMVTMVSIRDSVREVVHGSEDYAFLIENNWIVKE